MSANAREYVARPGPGSGVQPYGLFSVANMGDLPVHADVFGIEFQTPYCALPSGFVVNCPPGSKASITTGSYTTVTGDPFGVVAGMECGALTAGSNSQSPDEYTRDFVLEKLAAGEQRVVEAIFSRGLFGQAPGLSTGGASTVATPTTDNLVNAIQALEGAFGAVYGLPGVLHVPLKAMGQLANSHLLERDGSRWRTNTGTLVSIGNYAGYSPADAAPADAAHRWIYLTGPVSVWSQSSPFVSPWETSIDKSTNQIHRFAERTYIVTYECASFAVLANIEACC
jgi:hypothetical protein